MCVGALCVCVLDEVVDLWSCFTTIVSIRCRRPNAVFHPHPWELFDWIMRVFSTNHRLPARSMSLCWNFDLDSVAFRVFVPFAVTNNLRLSWMCVCLCALNVLPMPILDLRLVLIVSLSSAIPNARPLFTERRSCTTRCAAANGWQPRAPEVVSCSQLDSDRPSVLPGWFSLSYFQLCVSCL